MNARMRSLPATVVSSTLESPLDWPDATVLRELPIGVGPEDHPLLCAVQGKSAVEELGTLLAPVSAPVGVGGVGAVAVEGGKMSKVYVAVMSFS